ncbi:MAG: carboxypeptidase-like regulatory domain-containing protein [Saprospiraceae bacterium]|nr:carboxypeptidase-like regulatory domain-containing protein [Lewinella sp.]
MLRSISSLLALLLFSLLCPLQAQTLTGKVQNAQTNNPIIYAHVGVVGTGIGTITDENGDFKLNLPPNLPPQAVLQFSAIGFDTRQITPAHLRSNPIVKLQPASISLPEVTVTDRRRDRLITKGHYSRSRRIVTGWSGGISRGGVRAAHIRLPNHATDARLKIFRFHLAYNGYDSILFRVHFFYPADSGKGPGEAFALTEDIFLSHGNTTGEIELDLTPWQIITDQDFYVAVEVVRTYGVCEGGECLHFSVVLMKERIYYRNTSTGAWGSSKLGSPAFEIDMLY